MTSPSVQARLLDALPALEEKTPGKYLQSIRNLLDKAYGEDLLRTSPDQIYRAVQLPKGQQGPEFQIWGGLREKSFDRPDSDARLVRDDGAWIHFTFTVKQTQRDRLELCAYDFEIVFPHGSELWFVRLDLNEVGHPNEARECRSHIHPGDDDVQLPAPVMTPLETIRWFIWELRNRRDVQRPRTGAPMSAQFEVLLHMTSQRLGRVMTDQEKQQLGERVRVSKTEEVASLLAAGSAEDVLAWLRRTTPPGLTEPIST